MERRFHVKDLAPFASIEDLSDERESPMDAEKHKTVLADIDEETKISKTMTSTTSTKSPSCSSTPKTNLNVTNSTPRIDISRASSSSHQEDSSPERELILGKASNSKLEVVFGEEIVTDLHRSTEELSFHDNEETDQNTKKSSHMAPVFDVHQETFRKDSGCSADLAFLSISGRTSRVSSVGSVASGGSCASNLSAVSHFSAASRLSIASNLSRGSSPHRTSVETSFCGGKPVHSANVDDGFMTVASKPARSPVASETNAHQRFEKTLNKPPTKEICQNHSKGGRKRPTVENPKTQIFVSLHSDEEEESAGCSSTVDISLSQSSSPHQSAGKTSSMIVDSRTQTIIPLRGDADDYVRRTVVNNRSTSEENPFSPKRLKPFTNATLVNFISKYDVLREIRSPVSDDAPRQIYKEFQKFISLKDDDDNCSGCKGSSGISNQSSHQQKIEPTVMPAQVHRSRSLHDNSTRIVVKEDVSIMRKSDSHIQLPPAAVVTEQLSSSLHLSDSFLEQQTNADHPSSEHNFVDRCRSASATPAPSFCSSHLAADGESSFLQLDHRDHASRPTKSMTQLTRDIPTSSQFNDTVSSYTQSPLQVCSKSAREMRSVDKSKLHSGSFKSLFRTFFKKNDNSKSEKSYDAEFFDRTEQKSIPVPLANASRTKTTAEAIIVPLHSPDYDYEAAAATNASLQLVVGYAENDVGLSVISVTVADNSNDVKNFSKNLAAEKSDEIISDESCVKTDGLESVPAYAAFVKQPPTVSPVTSTCNLNNISYSNHGYENPVSTSLKLSHQHIMDAEDAPDRSPQKEESYSSLSSVSKKANEEETDDALSTDSDKNHSAVHDHGEEHKKLVNQEESFDELPYVPTTLPLERSVAVPIIPIKDRSNSDMIVHSVDRPRSTATRTASLDLNATTSIVTDKVSNNEKLHITLPRTDLFVNSPKKNVKNYNTDGSDCKSPSSPSLPSCKSSKSISWICFDESKQPERQSPRRITTLPATYASRHGDPLSTAVTSTSPAANLSITSANTTDSIHCRYASFNHRVIFVNPNECSCECHDSNDAKSATLSLNTISITNSNVRL